MGRETTVRIMKAQLVGCASGEKADFTASKEAFRRVSGTIQRVLNDFWAHWLSAHITAGDHIAVREWMAADVIWAKTPKSERTGDRVKCPVQAVTSELSNRLYHALRDTYPTLGTRPLVLAMNKESSRLIKTPATKSAYPRWMIILAGRGEFPSYSKEQPIPFDKANSRIVPPDTDDGPWTLEVRLESEPGQKKLTIHRLTIATKGRRLDSLRKTLWKIASGEWPWAGSDLVCRDGLWYAHLCYKLPSEEKPTLDASKTAYLNPACDRPVNLWIDGYPRWLRRHGNDVRHVRGQLAARLLSTAEAYSNASSARKGHGRKRAMAWRGKLSRRWLDFVKTYNERLARDVVETMCRQGVGVLAWYQPVGSRRDSRFLSRAGAVRGDGQWDWTQLTGLLARRCQEKGIKMATVRCGREGFSAKKRTQGNAK